jgi:hypothetical protein
MPTLTKNDKQVSNADVIDELEDHLSQGGCYVDYVRLDDKTAKVEIKTSGGMKAILKYNLRRKRFEVTLC